MLSRKALTIGMALAVTAFALNAVSAFADTINPDLANAFKNANASGKQLVANCFATW
jgi:hypothetical protein